MTECPDLTVYPRVGGGTPSWSELPTQGLSPRGRGNPLSYRVLNAAGSRVYPRVGGGTSLDPWPRYPQDIIGVYPRVGGGTSMTHERGIPLPGVYPRVGGGTPNALFQHVTGSIPAWAGEPGTPATKRVYPRVGGGTFTCARRPDEGSIPAWAGEPAPHNEPGRWRVYPRVGGGTPDTHHISPIADGLSPRGRGNPVRILVLGPTPSTWGLSPRGRGNPGWRGYRDRRSSVGLSPRGRGNPWRMDMPYPEARQRSIPAWAGETVDVSGGSSMVRDRVYPRVGGGTRFSSPA